MSIKVYYKRGKPSYQEAKLIKALQEKIGEKLAQDPNFKFEIARSTDELKNLHNTYCIDDAQIISETKSVIPQGKSESTTELENNNDDMTKNSQQEPMETNNNDEFQFETPEFETPDPFNDANPKVRDYVLTDKMSPGGTNHQVGSTQNISEPTDHNSAFAFPDDDSDTKQSGSNKTPKPEAAEQKPFNPQFDEMSTQKKNKQTKRYAKYIVEAVCTMVLEIGYVWWTTKDINEAALASYEINNEMDLSLLLSMSNDQQVTVRDFFIAKCSEAREEGKISIEDREELADALADVMMEKGFAPTPMQTLMMVSIKVVGSMGMKALMSRRETSGILDQLRNMNSENNSAGANIQNVAPQAQQYSDQTQQGPSTTYSEQQTQEPAVSQEASEILRQIENAEETESNLSPVHISKAYDENE